MMSSPAMGMRGVTPCEPGEAARRVRRFRAVHTTPTCGGGYVVAGCRVASRRRGVVGGGRKGSARLTAVTTDRPVDAVIMATVDSFDIDARVTKLA